MNTPGITTVISMTRSLNVGSKVGTGVSVGGTIAVFVCVGVWVGVRDGEAVSVGVSDGNTISVGRGLLAVSDCERNSDKAITHVVRQSAARTNSTSRRIKSLRIDGRCVQRSKAENCTVWRIPV
jgi:hypothetical protein